MKSNIAVPVPTDVFLGLSDFLRKRKDERDPVDVVAEVVRDFLQRQQAQRTDGQPGGYKWKSVFLPTGTQIRMSYKGRLYYATVEGDEVVYQGRPISPSTLANKITQTSRNAWRDLWIKRPGGDQEWTLADDLRPEVADQADAALREFLGDASHASDKGRERPVV